MWRHHGRALWRRGGGAWYNVLLRTTASNVNCWADVSNHVTRLWQAGDTDNVERQYHMRYRRYGTESNIVQLFGPVKCVNNFKIIIFEFIIQNGYLVSR